MYTNILGTISSIFSQYITYLLCTSSMKKYSLVGLCFVVIRHLIEQFGGGRSQVIYIYFFFKYNRTLHQVLSEQFLYYSQLLCFKAEKVDI